MAFVSLPGGFGSVPPDVSQLAGGVTAATVTNATVMTFDGTGDMLGWVGTIPKTGTITELLFHTGTVSTAGATFRMSIQGVDASGLPDGSVAGSGTVVVATSDDNTWKTVSISSGSGAVTAGQMVAIVLDVSSGTPNTVIISQAPTWMVGQGFPYIVQNTSGSWGKLGASNLAIPFMMNYGGTFEYAYGMNCASGVASSTIGNGNGRALRFQVPVPMQVVGVRAGICNPAAGANFTIYLTDSSGTTITSVSVDGDNYLGTTLDALGTFMFDGAYDLSANTTYYVSVEQTTANNLALFQFSVDSAAHMGAAPGGAQFYLGTRTGAGAFSDTTTSRPLVYLIPGGFSDGSGGGTTIAGTPLLRGLA